LFPTILFSSSLLEVNALTSPRPNLVPPVTTVEACLAYRSRIQKALGDDDVKLLMSLYLHPNITPETIKQAAEYGIVGASDPWPLTVNEKNTE